MKPVSEHLPFLDYFRGLAILSVYFYHALGISFGTDQLPWNGWFRGWDVPGSFYILFPTVFGFAGVAIFFAVSGFCIHLSHERSRLKSYKIFFLRRFFRIYPPYLLALIFFATLFYPPHGYGWGHIHDVFVPRAKDFATHFLLIHNFSNKFYYGDINGAFWSIAIEVQLYMLYPLLLWLVVRLGWMRVLWITGIIELGLHGIEALWMIPHPSQEFSRFFTSSPFCYWFSWSIGAALADAYLKGESLPFRGYSGYIWPVLFVGCYFFKPMNPFTFTVAALCSTYLMAYCLACPTLHLTLNSWGKYALEHLRWVGVVSYSAYLLHQPFLQRIPILTSLIFYHHRPPPLVLFGICFFLWFPIFGLSYLFYRYVELPSIAWGKRVIGKRWGAIPATNAPVIATSAPGISP